MTQLLEIKDKIIKFVGKNEVWLAMVVKFVLSLVLFMVITVNLPYMSKISNIFVPAVLALICAFLPCNVIIWMGGLLTLLQIYSLSLEAALVTLVLMGIIYFLYFRFAPKDGVIAVLMPIACKFNIMGAVPVGTGLLRKPQSAIAMVCGTVIFYFVDGIRKNASSFITVSGEEEAATTKLNMIIGQLIGNKEMYLAIGVLVMGYLLVYFVRKLNVTHSWLIAVIVGSIFQSLSLFAGYLIMGVEGKLLGVAIGTIVSVIVGIVLLFFFRDLDYARTENLQFEDDEYYYYVKAIPKKMVASKEKTVKHFGNTASIGKRIDHSKKELTAAEEETSRKVIAQQLDIDEDWLK